MNFVLWFAQIVIAFVFFRAGYSKVSKTKDELVQSGIGFASYTPLPLVRLIGTLELLGAIGVVLPMLTGVLPWLTPIAAAGLALTMLGAITLHVSRGEYMALSFPLLLLALAAIIAVSRMPLLQAV